MHKPPTKFDTENEKADRLLLDLRAAQDEDTVRKIKSGKIKINEATLCKAAANGHLKCVAFILAHGNMGAPERGSALVETGSFGQVSCMRLLVEAGCTNLIRNLALKKAAFGGRTEYVEAILPFADKEHDSFRAAELATLRGHEGCLRLLLPDDQGTALKDSILVSAASNGHLDCMTLLLGRKSCSTDAKIKALCAAIDNAQSAAIERLLDDKAVRVRCETTGDPLLSSITAGNVTVLDALFPLLKKDIVKVYGSTMLDAATVNQSSECLRFLLPKISSQPTTRHIMNALHSDSPACVQVLAPVVEDLNDEVWESGPNIKKHPLVKACFLGQFESIAALAHYTRSPNIINAAVCNGMRTYLTRGTLSRKDLQPLFQKTTYEKLRATLHEVNDPDKTHIIDFSAMSSSEKEYLLHGLERELEVLKRSNDFHTCKSFRKKPRVTGSKL